MIINEKCSNQNRKSISLEQYVKLLELTNDILFILDNTGKILEFITNKEKFLYLSKEDMINKNIIDVLPQKLKKLSILIIKKAIESKQIQEYSNDILIDGQVMYFQARLISCSENKVLACIRDITNIVNQERDKRKIEVNYRKIFEENFVGIEIYNKEGKLTAINNACLEMFGIDDKKEVLGFSLFNDPNIPEEEKQKIIKTGKTDFVIDFKFDLVEEKKLYKTNETGTKHLFVKIRKINFEQNEIGYMVFVTDVTYIYNKEKELDYLANHDILTNLKNRYYFEKYLEKEINIKDYPITLIMGDIDGLKIINDSLGHTEGDRYIKEISKKLTKTFHSAECISRIGGDEFIIIYKNFDEEYIKTVIKKAVDEISTIHYDIVKPTVSFGYSILYNDDKDIYFAYKEAENKMYKTKLFKKASSRNDTLKSLLKVLEHRTHENAKHGRQIENLAVKIALKMGLSYQIIDEIRILSKLHDIGKIGIPDSILNKKDKLNEEEWKIMQTHSEIGFRIASSINQIHTIAKGILHIHEWWNGNGYPTGLEGEQIPIISRIVAVADAYDSMTSNRVYRTKLTKEQAVNLIISESGTHFDPIIVDYFVKVIN